MSTKTLIGIGLGIAAGAWFLFSGSAQAATAPSGPSEADRIAAAKKKLLR